jgi:sulfite reductase (ferredoxin)
MLRVKIPQGVLTCRSSTPWPRSPSVLARLRAHHDPAEHAVPLRQAARRRARDAPAGGVGLTTREACGNSVRNITACPYAGVAADEPFDVTPYAEALTRYSAAPSAQRVLPRKFKIAFEGCAHDHIARGDQRHRLDGAGPHG